MPLREQPYTFPGLRVRSFRDFPPACGLASDRYGNADRRLARGAGRTPASFNAIERLCYIGTRGMGALEYAPSRGRGGRPADIEIDALVRLASEVLGRRRDLRASLHGTSAPRRCGTSCRSGRPRARAAKAVIAYNRRPAPFAPGRSTGPGFEHWLLKFDGSVRTTNASSTSRTATGVELAYAEMACARE